VCRTCICRPIHIHTYAHTYVHTTTYVHTGRTYMCGLRTYVHRGIYISVWLHARYADENCALLDYYAASRGNFLPTFFETCQSHPQGSRTPPQREERSSQLLRGGSPETTHLTLVTKRIISWKMGLSVSPPRFVSFTRSGVPLCTASPSWFTFQRILPFKFV